MKVNKTKLNLSIDILMFMVMIPIAGIGFLMKYALVPGFKRNDIYGCDVELFYCGIDRHQWGTIHLILSFALLFLLLLHFIFHWKQIVCIFNRIVGKRVWRITLSILLLGYAFVSGILPLFITPKVEEGISHHARNIEIGKGYYYTEIQHRKRAVGQPVSEQLHKQLKEVLSTADNRNEHKHNNRNNIEIYGYMTINDVAEKNNISLGELELCIGIPNGHSSEKLGRLRKQYDFHLTELRDYFENRK